MAKASYYEDECPYAASQGRLWPPSIKRLFLGMLLSSGHQSYLREGRKGFVSPLSLLTRCDIKYWHISTGKRNGAWLIVATLTCLLSSPGNRRRLRSSFIERLQQHLPATERFPWSPSTNTLQPKRKSNHLPCSDCPLEFFEKVACVYHWSTVLCCQLTCGGKTAKPDCGYLCDPYTALPLCLKRAWREIQQYPHLPAGRGGTGKPPDLGACAATARAVGKVEMITLTSWPLIQIGKIS